MALVSAKPFFVKNILSVREYCDNQWLTRSSGDQSEDTTTLISGRLRKIEFRLSVT